MASIVGDALISLLDLLNGTSCAPPLEELRKNSFKFCCVVWLRGPGLGHLQDVLIRGRGANVFYLLFLSVTGSRGPKWPESCSFRFSGAFDVSLGGNVLLIPKQEPCPLDTLNLKSQGWKHTFPNGAPDTVMGGEVHCNFTTWSFYLLGAQHTIMIQVSMSTWRMELQPHRKSFLTWPWALIASLRSHSLGL